MTTGSMMISHMPTSFAMSRQKIKLNNGCLRMQWIVKVLMKMVMIPY